MKKRLLLLVSTFAIVFSSVAWGQVYGPGTLERQKEWLKNREAKKKSEPPDISQHKVNTRACADTDIMGGVWKMIYFRETPPKRNDKFSRMLKHQYLSMDTGYFYAKLRSRESIDDTTKIMKLLKPDTRKNYAQKYAIKDVDGRTEIVFTSGDVALYRHSCSIVLEPASVFKPGDMILTGYTAGGKTVLYELYRRWF